MKNLFLTTLTLFSLSVFAGDKGGNGGFTYVCGNKLELVDLMEVKHIPFLAERIQITPENLPYMEQIQKRVNLLKKIDLKAGEQVANEINRVLSSLKFKTVPVAVPRDLGYVPQVAGCSIVNVINYDLQIIFDQNLFHSLSEFNKAALIVHESIYAVARRLSRQRYYVDIPTSLPMRRMVALLFSENFEAHKDVLKELTQYYLRESGQDLEQKNHIEICLDQIYLNPGKSYFPLDEASIAQMKFTPKMFHYSYIKNSFFSDLNQSFYDDIMYDTAKNSKYYRQYLPAAERKYSRSIETFYGSQFEKVPARCDGTAGESFRHTTETFTLDHPLRFFIDYRPARGLSNKKLNARMVVKVLNQEGRSLTDKTFEYEDLYARISFLEEDRPYFNMGLIESDQKKTFSEETKNFLEAR